MDLYGSGRPADWGFNRPGGMIKKAEWESTARGVEQ